MTIDGQLTTTAEFRAAYSSSNDPHVLDLEAAVRRREAVLGAISFAATRFLAPADWDRDIRDVLAQLGEATDATRVYLFEGAHASDGSLLVSLRNEWLSPDSPARPCDTGAPDAARQNMDLRALGLGRWAALERGETIHGSLETLPPDERAYFERIGIQSIAAVPVFAGDEWWGYLGFGDATTCRTWMPAMLETLRAAGATIGAAIYRKATEERLRESEERYRLLTDAAFEGVFIHDMGVLIESNCALSRMIGYDVGELVGRNTLELIVSDEAREHIKQKMAADSPEPFEAAVLRKDGSVMIAEITGRNLTYKGKPARVTTVQDVTEHRRVEAELRRRESQLAEAQAIAHLGSWDWDICSTSLSASDELYRIYGLPVGAPLRPETLLDRVHADDAELVRCALDVAKRDAKDFAIEHRVMRAANDVRTIRLDGRVVVDASGMPIRIIGAVLDITERKAAELVAHDLVEEQAARAAAEESRRRSDLLAEASRLLGSSFDYQSTLGTLTRLAVPALGDFCTVDMFRPDGTLARIARTHVDPAKEQMLGDLTRWLRPGAPMVEHLRRPLFDGEPTFVHEFTDEMLQKMALDADHEKLVWLVAPRSCVAVPLKVGGKVIGVFALYASESPRRFGPSDVELVNELARRAALAVENARLYQAAEQATHARDQMLGIVAHDLRNPLGTIVMASGLLNETIDASSAAHRQVAIMRRAADRMNRLIGDLLDVKRLENGRLTVERQPVPLSDLLSEAAESLRGAVESANLELVLDASADLPHVLADTNRMQQVLSNLIGNAVKFTPKGGRITLRGERALGGTRVSVADTGTGMSADQLPKVFDQFWQGSRTDRRGIGLGLAIAKGVVEAHEGQIWVESAVGKGTTFFFTLPVSQA